MSLPAFFALPRRSRAFTVASASSGRLCVFAHFVKVCAAVCALTLLLAPPSQAGQWVITLSGGVSLSPSGTAASAYQFVDGQVNGSGSSSGPLSLTSGPGAASCSIGNRGPVPTALTVTAKLVWTADYDWDTPPLSVDVLETGDAVAPVTFPALPDVPPMPDGAFADDGLSDGASVDVAANGGMMSHGRHFSHLTVAPGQFSVSLPTRTLVAFVPDGTPRLSKTSLYYTVQIDNRSVYITSNFPSPTYRKGAVDALHQTGRWENNRVSNGSLIDDTVVPGADGTHAIYTPNYHPGSWGNDSTYGWQASLPNSNQQTLSEAGTFNSTSSSGSQTIPTFEGVYHHPPVSDGNSDTITLSLQDGVDGATAANFYTIRFHDPVPSSGWLRDPNSPVIHPIPTSGPSSESDVSLGEWSRIGPYPNRGPGDITPKVSATVGTKQSASTTKGTILGLDASVPLEPIPKVLACR